MPLTLARSSSVTSGRSVARVAGEDWLGQLEERLLLLVVRRRLERRSVAVDPVLHLIKLRADRLPLLLGGDLLDGLVRHLVARVDDERLERILRLRVDAPPLLRAEQLIV